MSPQPRRVAIGQIDNRCGDLEHNAEVMRHQIDAAREAGCELIVFPELSLTGYLIDDRFADAAIMLHGDMMERFRAMSKPIDICLGFIEETPSSLFFNSAAYLADGKIKHLHRKVYPPTYGMFNERRYFAAGWDVSAFDTRIARSAVLICGDAWHLPLPYMAAHDGADVLLILAASSRQGLADTTPCEKAWEWMCRSYALTLSCFVVFANRSGNDGKLDFWGGSFVVGPDGNLIAQSQTAGADLVVADLDIAQLRRQRIKLPFRRDDSLAYTLQLGQRVMASKVNRDAFYGDPDTPRSPPPTPR